MWKTLNKLFKRKKRSDTEAVLVASTQEPATMPESTDSCTILEVEGREVDYACGHRHPNQYTLNLYGEKIELSKEGLAQRELCANCDLAELKKITIRCASCGFVIMPGDPVALYCDDPKIFKKHDQITKVDKSVVGCLRWDCCPSGGFFAGHWTGERFQSAFEGGSVIGEALRNPGKVVTVKLNPND